jgi:hypothetical protein
VAKGWSSVDSELRATQKDSLDQLRTALNSVCERQQQIVSRLESLQNDQGKQFETVLSAAGSEAGALCRRADERQERAEKELAGTIERFEKTLAGLAQQSDAVSARVGESMANSARLVDSHFAAMREGLASLNAVLEKLGDKHTVLEIRDDSRKEPARGWGWFRRKNGAE